MKISINRQSNVSIREQIYLEISQRIRSGLIEPNFKLPSVRDLSEELSISLVTAHHVYKMLDNSGLTETIRGKGTFVRKGKDNTSGDHVSAPFDWQLSISDYLPRASFWSQSAVRLPPNILDLASACVHHSLLPMHLIQESIYQTLKKFPHALGQYANFQGDTDFLLALTEYLKLLSIKLKPHQLLVTNGTQQGIDLFARTFLGPGDTIALETPCFSAAIDAFRLSHANLQPIPVDANGIRVDILEDLAPHIRLKAIYTVPTGQNPTGAIMSLSRRQDLLSFAREHNVLILEDEPHRELEMTRIKTSALPPPLKALDTDGRVIYLKGFSKFLFPGMRLGLLAADGSIYNRLLAAKSIADLGSPLWLQKSLLPFFQNPQLLRSISKMSSLLDARRKNVLQTLDQLLDPRIARPKQSAGLHLWLSMPLGIHTDYLIPEAHRRGVHFLPGSIFYPGEPETNHLRICWTNLADEDLPKALEILCKLLNDAVKNHDA
ncbi:PLP-dependent aminotransferase family protein [Sporomusa malonica]|uniref:Transcriptional regulator, GntR family n=1 Tax=Sporomusa malonica TaxID=112901 RepID=A0A1W2E0I5_9FIRM|nr:PLP-dependent aminotransferase family protein [Sporomusa malonica]SMD03274.1 transcriptional regulator, GntR family [Sporomusa malonica]